MNRTFIGGTVIVMIVVGIVLSSQLGTTTEYTREVETIVEEVHPEWATDEEAVKAAQDVIRKKELQAQEAELVSQITGLQSELDEVRKELGVY